MATEIEKKKLLSEEGQTNLQTEAIRVTLKDGETETDKAKDER